MPLTDDQLAALARTVAATADEELTCEQMLAYAAPFVEAMVREPEHLSDVLRRVAQHLQVCAECREEIEILIELHRR